MNTTIKSYSSAAFIRRVTPLAFVPHIRIWKSSSFPSLTDIMFTYQSNQVKESAFCGGLEQTREEARREGFDSAVLLGSSHAEDHTFATSGWCKLTPEDKETLLHTYLLKGEQKISTSSNRNRVSYVLSVQCKRFSCACVSACIRACLRTCMCAFLRTFLPFSFSLFFFFSYGRPFVIVVSLAVRNTSQQTDHCQL